MSPADGTRFSSSAGRTSLCGWITFMPTQLGSQPPADPSISSTETGGRRSQIFCGDERIYRQSGGHPAGLTGDEKGNSTARILRNAKWHLRGPSSAGQRGPAGSPIPATASLTHCSILSNGSRMWLHVFIDEREHSIHGFN
jgi:hypothetical protein